MAQTKPKYAFFKGQIVPFEQATVSVMTHALNYGTGVFGGMRGYWNADEEQLFVFRPLDHFERFLQSAALLRMTFDYTPDDLLAALREVLQAENYRENCYIRPLAYKSSEVIGVRLHDLECDITIFALPFGSYLKDDDEGSHVCFSAWRRIDDNAIPARGKIAGAYANSALIKTDAMLAGYDEALVLNNDGHVSEASAANLFIVRKGTVITPPVSSNILEGIVRRSMMHFMREDLNLEVVEREIDRTEVYLADEIFLCGTGVQLTPVTRVEHRVVGDGRIGPITSQVRDIFFKVVTGRMEKYRGWVAPMYDVEHARPL